MSVMLVYFLLGYSSELAVFSGWFQPALVSRLFFHMLLFSNKTTAYAAS
jgi:hypothetical protein